MQLQKNIRLLGLYKFLFAVDFYLPIKVVYFYNLTHSYSTAASIVSFTLLFAALMEVPTGIFSDFVGRKRTIILGSFCSVMAYAMYALGFDYWILVFGAFLDGTSRSFFSGNNDAYLHNLLSDENKESEFHHYYGKLNSILTVGSVIGSLLSGVIASWSIGLFMWVNLIPRITGLVVSLFLKEIKREEHSDTNIFSHLFEALKDIKRNINLRYLSLATIFSGAGLSAYEFQAAVFSAVWPTWAIGLARAVQEVGGIPGYYFAGKVIEKLGFIKVVSLSMVSGVLGNILAGLSKSFFSPIFIMISLPLYGPADTADQHLIQKEFSEKQRATTASLNSLGSSIYFALVLYICGLIANQHGPFIALISTQLFVIPSLYFKSKFLYRMAHS
jgi:MFS family permease